MGVTKRWAWPSDFHFIFHWKRNWFIKSQLSFAFLKISKGSDDFMDTIKQYSCCCCCCIASVVSDSVWPHRRAAHQAPPSLGFSRQEHWSGLPFPSPMQESEKWKWSHSVVSDSSQPHGLQPTRLLRPWDFPGKSAGVGCHCLLQIMSIPKHNNSVFVCVARWSPQ